MQVEHTIDEGDDLDFETAGNAAVAIRGESDGTLTVNLVPKDGSESERWEWDAEKVVSLLVNGHLIPEEGTATDYLEA